MQKNCRNKSILPGRIGKREFLLFMRKPGFFLGLLFAILLTRLKGHLQLQANTMAAVSFWK
jgi:hypothetical protein